MVVLGCSRGARGAAGGSARGARPRRAPGDGERSAGPVHARPAPARRAPWGSARERHPRGTLRHRPRERIASEHRALAAFVLQDGACARARALRRAAPPRADDADDLPDGAHPSALPSRRDLPRVGRPRLDEVRSPDLGVHDRPDRPSHRGLGAGEGVPEPVAARRLRGDPERRARPESGGGRRTRAPDRVRGPAGAAEGATGPAPRVARDPRSHGAPTDRRRCRPARRAAPAHEASRLRRGDRRRRLPQPGGAHGHAAPREGARRAVDRAGELRHGAHARLRVRAARRRVGHPRLPRGARHPRLRSRCRPTIRTRSSPPSRRSSADEPRRVRMGESARDLAVERYAWPTIARRLEEVYSSVTGIRVAEARAA